MSEQGTQEPPDPEEGVLAQVEAIVEDEADTLAVASALAEEADGPLVGIIASSAAHRATMEAAGAVLDEAEVPYELVVLSAHRDPVRLAEHSAAARSRGLRALIAGAALGAALPGVVAAHTDLPVIGVPLTTSASIGGGLDALLAIAQMPTGVPVATVGVDNPKNAAHLAVRILSIA